MNLNAYREIRRRYGARALAQSIALAAVGKVVESQVLVVYVMDIDSAISLPAGLEVRILEPAEITALGDGPGLELPSSFIRQALANGDHCFGAFLDGEFCGYAWYAMRPARFSNGLTAECDARYAYAYKNLTLPSARGQSIQKWVKRVAVGHYRGTGRAGILVAIDATNHASRRSTEGAGARQVGHFAWWRRGDRVFSYSSPGAKRYGFRMYATHILRARGKPVRVEVVRDLSALAPMDAEWSQILAAQPRGNGVFYERWWLEIMHSLYASPSRTPYFVLFRDENRLLGFAPLMLEKKGATGGFVRRLHFWGGIRGSLNNMAPDILVAAPSDAERCVEALRLHLRGPARGAWDLLELPYLSAESPTLESLRERLRPVVRTEPMKVFVLHLPSDFESYRATLDRRTFSEVRRRRRRLTDQGIDVELLCVERLTVPQRDAIMRMHSARQEVLRTHGHDRYSLFENSRDREVMLQLLDRGADHGATRHYLLLIGSEIAAFFLCFTAGKALHLFVTAFDEKFASYGPTKMLFLDIARTEIEQFGSTLLNLSAGEGRWKEEFTQHAIENFHFSVENPALGSRLRLLAWKLPRKLLRRS